MGVPNRRTPRSRTPQGRSKPLPDQRPKQQTDQPEHAEQHPSLKDVEQPASTGAAQQQSTTIDLTTNEAPQPPQHEHATPTSIHPQPQTTAAQVDPTTTTITQPQAVSQTAVSQTAEEPPQKGEQLQQPMDKDEQTILPQKRPHQEVFTLNWQEQSPGTGQQPISPSIFGIGTAAERRDTHRQTSGRLRLVSRH